MSKKDVVFVAREEYNNLGVGYLVSALMEAGYSASVIDLNAGKRAILRLLKASKPVITGFSLISYGYLDEFTSLIRYLRENNIPCHFTAGGHFCSLNPEETFELIPQLDSIVRYEGERTIVELVKCITGSNKLNEVRGLVYIDKGKISVNPLMPLVSDLDSFPFPARKRLKTFFGSPMATILAGRGCMNNCSFCNTREFYRQAGGPLKRVRKPALVVKEMKQLYRKRNCSIFMFMDDDFPVSTNHWADEFCSELDSKGLSGSVLWKICCRPDEVDERLFRMMKAHGLFLVFLGIEDGTTEGLRKMNKHVAPDQINRSIAVLKKLKIGIDFGFMLFHPSTTFESFDKNLEFLNFMCSDGYMPVTFLRMIPLYKTKVEEELREDGRLIPGIPGTYTFFDDRLNKYYEFIHDIFSVWLLHPYGLANVSRWISNYYFACSRLTEPDEEFKKIGRRLKGIIRESNLFLTGSLKELSILFQSDKQTDTILTVFRNKSLQKHQFYLDKVRYCLDSLYYHLLRKKSKN